MSNKIYPERGLPPVEQIKGPCIVLVNPQMGENIGAAARAMLNCGLTDLRLVSPRDGWPNEAARINSSGALEVIERAKLFDTLSDAVADCTFVVGTTSRSRDMTKPVLSPDQAVQAIVEADSVKNAPTSAIVFGPERTGLVNEDITCCDALLTIPLNPNYASLNIAQAVLLVAYLWRTSAVKIELPDILHLSETDVATKAEIENVLLHLADVLDDSGFFTTKTQKPTMLQNLRNMFQRMRLTSQEAQTFHGIIKSLRGKEWKK